MTQIGEDNYDYNISICLYVIYFMAGFWGFGVMGFWFLSAAIANYSAGKLPSILQTNNLDLFTFLTIMSLTAGIVLILIAPIMEKLVKK